MQGAPDILRTAVRDAVVADHQHIGGCQTEPIAGGPEDRRVGLLRAQLEGEQVGVHQIVQSVRAKDRPQVPSDVSPTQLTQRRSGCSTPTFPYRPGGSSRLDREGDTHPLLTAGFLNGSAERLNTARNAIDEQFSRWSIQARWQN